ncbi:cytosolic arginine sensor for mTORC1 subunit 2 isoform X1 [Solea solea]|uniref:cytosolic arginine sensor for mTORC1 subunit 2 isoform X1 n=1 Tax=Solea solea TaxID=90069 RepID=UPI00272A98CD|nr:cytosolic arginine sensor for mTORC1 subunit 2 isoform X1 [Solea solea]
MELHILEHSLKVASIEKEGIQICTHGLIKLAFLASKTRCKFFSLTETPEDYTIIVDEEGFKELPQSEHISVADATWLALNVVSGGGNASNSQPIGVTKIAKSVIAPLADHNISVFMLSTYQTDYILVRERDLPMVMHTLSSEFTLLRVVNGETVAAHNLGVTNGFVKPKLVPRPIIHPLSSPSNMFCVTSLDPDTLPSVATLLMDVMFYSGGFFQAETGAGRGRGAAGTNMWTTVWSRTMSRQEQEDLEEDAEEQRRQGAGGAQPSPGPSLAPAPGPSVRSMLDLNQPQPDWHNLLAVANQPTTPRTLLRCWDGAPGVFDSSLWLWNLKP